ncbi:DUF305 domain-containing protein [Streptomyces sp. Ag109_G2-15]|uniref:DUF305 domain-containing protein n=1 Tax=Streptomyces sp. Ag109_G2-15 TaxID=1938850 RepID=UPI000BDB7EE8|nr:DUF305 domain-containing protein [Streptomyces sp. Ag109_G2-15]SOD89714.1 protein of unknown function [Streptomyces sp. Ag109_G2-15]
MTDSTNAQGRKPAFGRWLIAAAAALVVLVLALSFLAVNSHRNDTAIDVPTADSADAGFTRDMATNTELARLGTLNGRQAEILYLQLMYYHHMGGVDMARACARQCTVPQERKLAQGMVDAQQSEMELMAGLLKERGSAPR